ncbi:LmbE family N-acetylglucosaminyl deacetylase [Propionibacteriaceae bacterium ES.041]|nr:LmbE family N-acetylglucosaminyl deacetylase [Propionibacteriaceae bacterium ES.041]
MTAEQPHSLADVPPVTEAHPGTPAECWRGWREGLPELSYADWRRVVVVAPHPDDEILGVGGLLHLLARSGVPVTVLAVTDGTAAPAPAGWSAQELGVRRSAESERACALLGLPAPLRLGLQDGAVTADEAVLVELIAGHLDQQTICLSTWPQDGHPDHDACGRAAARAAAGVGARLLSYPVWWWHWGRPDDPTGPRPAARRVALPADLQQLKAEAVAAFTSQLEPPGPGRDPVLPRPVLDRLVTAEEVLIE